MPKDEIPPKRKPGGAQRFADRAGGPTVYEGMAYQTGVSCVEALALLHRQQQSPMSVFRLRCESRELVPGGQLGYDLSVDTPGRERLLEMKSSPVESEVKELLARLKTVAAQPRRKIQLVYGKATKWTEALDSLLRNAGEAADDGELMALVAASADEARGELLEVCLEVCKDADVGPKALLQGMLRPEFLQPSQVAKEVNLHAWLLAGDRADDLVRRLTQVLDEAFPERRTLVIGDLHVALMDAKMILAVCVVAPSSDTHLAQAVAVLETCPAPLPEPVLARALGLVDGAVAALLSELIEARVILRDGNTLWRPRGSQRISPSAAGQSLRETLAGLISLPLRHSDKVAQVPNVLALSQACARDNPDLVARAFRVYDKAAKATGDLSTVYRLAAVSLEAATNAPADGEQHRVLLELRGHARICGTAWTLQRVGQESEASVQMDYARIESEQAHSADNLAFVDKCQGRLSRLRAEASAGAGNNERASELYALSREQLAGAYQAFTALLQEPDYAHLAEEPGECLALRARTALSQGQLDEAEKYAGRAHDELDYLGPRCKAWADVCLIDSELALARVREGMEPDLARALLLERSHRLHQVLEQFGETSTDDAIDFGASEIVARTCQMLAQLAQETGHNLEALRLFREAATQFERVDQQRSSYRCLARALELGDELPQKLVAALNYGGADDSTRVEAFRLHTLAPVADGPPRHWEGLVRRGQLVAAAREHRWTDRVSG
jgi:hypothetical protein